MRAIKTVEVILRPFPNAAAAAAVGFRMPAFRLVLLALLVACSLSPAVWACPFCTALQPTLSQQRDEAAVAALAECEQGPPQDYRFRLLQMLHGKQLLGKTESLELPASAFADAPNASLKAGSLALLLASPVSRDNSDFRWKAIPLNETSYAYIARAPSTRRAARERLPFFVRYLEHADPLLAEDAYQEFGHARFDEVAEVAEHLPFAAFRKWLLDRQTPQQRKGFYGVALGLAAGDQARRENAEFLRKLILQPASDFRAGFDGLLGGYLLCGGDEALELIDRRYLADPEAPPGDVRHAMTALRFYHEYGRNIPPKRLAEALQHLLSRRQFAAAAIVDLARWQAWDATAAVTKLSHSDELKDLPTRRAIIGFLLLSPREEARAESARLRRLYPAEVAETEKKLNLLGGAR